MLPAFASPVNPVDVTPVWSRFAELYPGLTDLLARSGEVDVIIPVLLQRAALDTSTAEGLRDVVEGLRADGVPVPVHVCWVAPRDARPNADLLQDARIPCFEWPARTARAIGHARRYAVAREQTVPAAPAPARRAGPTPTDPRGAASLLAELGIRTATSALCRTADEAVAAARAFPVVVKLAEAAHRTELGGVRLGLADADAVRAAATDLLTQGPVLVQPQLTGVEIAIGAVRDPVFGPVVMVGLGGIWVEVLGDVAFAMAPLSRAEARPLLAADDVTELDLNPVLATADGAIAVDWKIGT
jgi:acetyltransferase